MADKETIRPPQQADYPKISAAGFRFFQQLSQWINNTVARITTSETAITALQAATKVNYVDRGDPSAPDKTEADVTLDGAWKTGGSSLDLSAVIPAGAVAAIIQLNGNSITPGQYFQLRKPGKTYADVTLEVQVASLGLYLAPALIPCDSTRKWEYKGSGSFASLGITVRGWLI